MSGTHLFYNGVLMRGCTLKQFDTDIVHDDSDTDVYYSKTTVGVESMLIGLVGINPNQPPPPQYAGGFQADWQSVAVPYVDNETVVDRLHEVQERLQENRKDFWLAINGATAQRQPGRVAVPGAPNGTTAPPIPANDGYFNDSYRVVLAATGLTNEDIAKPEVNGAMPDIGFIEAFDDGGTSAARVTKISRKDVVDLNNGPKPRNVRVTQVFGGRALRVSFTIEVCRCFCRPSGSSSAPPVKDADKVKGVISNRWSLSESTDAEWKTTHNIEGKLVVADARYKAHAMKLIVHPSLFPYAKLNSRSFTTDKTGLALAYRFEIKEAGPAAPKGIVDWDGTYKEQAAMGGKKTATLTVRVTGQAWPSNAGNAPDPDREHKTYLLAMAYRIAQARIRFTLHPFNPIPGQNRETNLVTDMVVVEQMAKPVIELHMSVLYNDAPANDGVASDMFGLRLANMGSSLESTIPGYESKWWDIPPTHAWDIASEKSDNDAANPKRGSGTYYDCYFQTPCSEWHAMPRGATVATDVTRHADVQTAGGNGNSGSNGLAVRGLQVPVDPNLTANLTNPNEPPPGQLINSAAHGWNNEQANFAYIQAEIDTTYDINSGNVQLPLSKSRSISQSVSGETSVVVRLHAGAAQRTITMVATRIGKWPQVPEPKAVIQSGTMKETFLDGKAVNDAPKLTKDGMKFIYSTQIKWVYALSRIPQKNSGDLFRAASNPMDKSTPAQNAIKLTDYFSSGEIEMA